MKGTKEKAPVLAVLRDMKIGETHAFPISRTSYIRSVCVSFGLEWNKRFTTRIDRQTCTITVERAS